MDGWMFYLKTFNPGKGIQRLRDDDDEKIFLDCYKDFDDIFKTMSKSVN